MIARLIGAAVRGFLVGLLIISPTLILPSVGVDDVQISILIAILSFFLICTEYNSKFPSIISFVHAPFFNRLRFLMALLMVALMAAIFKGQSEPTLAASALTSIAALMGNWLDFPMSPVRLVMQALSGSIGNPDMIRAVAGLVSAISLVSVVAFAILVYGLGWPSRPGGAFNVWINLPLFDPTKGIDAMDRLRWDARFSMIIGVALIYALPALVIWCDNVTNMGIGNTHQTLIWMLTAWGFIPASLFMRGLALARISGMIAAKRRRALVIEQSGILSHV